jgi:K+-transporting ATPase KdpF subunit
MHLDYWLGAAVAILLTAYLVHALVRAERY